MYSIMTVIRNEHHYLKEWLDYHLNLGFDKIVLLEDYNSDSHEDIVQKCVYPEKVLLLHQGYLRGNRQIQYLNRQLKRVKNTYCAFIDVDEFIQGDYKSLIINNNPYLIKGKCYGANKLIHQPQSYKAFKDDYKGLMEYDVPNKGYKIFAYVKDGFKISNIHGSLVMQKIPVKDLWYDHYFTKSFTEWMNRLINISKGIRYGVNHANLEEFFKWNPELLYHKEIENYIKQIKLYGDSFYRDLLRIRAKYEK